MALCAQLRATVCVLLHLDPLDLVDVFNALVALFLRISRPRVPLVQTNTRALAPGMLRRACNTAEPPTAATCMIITDHVAASWVSHALLRTRARQGAPCLHPALHSDRLESHPSLPHGSGGCTESSRRHAGALTILRPRWSSHAPRWPQRSAALQRLREEWESSSLAWSALCSLMVCDASATHFSSSSSFPHTPHHTHTHTHTRSLTCMFFFFHRKHPRASHPITGEDAEKRRRMEEHSHEERQRQIEAEARLVLDEVSTWHIALCTTSALSCTSSFTHRGLTVFSSCCCTL
jgi:hypothetical protein